MANTLKNTENYQLIEGTGMGKGCFAVIQKSNNKQTLWNTGSEGAEWAEWMAQLNDTEFENECHELAYH